VVAAAYTLANITVDAQGRITAASNGVVATSVFGRTGAVSALTGDYAAFYPQIANSETISGSWTYSGTNIHSSGSLRFNDNIPINFGTGIDAVLDYDSAGNDLELLLNGTTNFEIIADTNRMRFRVNNGVTGVVSMGYGNQDTGGIMTGNPDDSGNLTGAKTHSISKVLKPVGLAVWQHLNISSATDTNRNMWQHRVRNTGGASVALTVVQDSTIPDGAWMMVQARGAAMTLVEGSGVTLERYLGSGAPATGTANLARGGWCYILKTSNTSYDIVQGVGLT